MSKRVKIKEAIIKDLDKNKKTEVAVVYQDNDTFAYKIFGNRYVTLNPDMSIKRNITVQDPEYLLCNRCDEQDREWLKKRQYIVAVLDAINGASKMKQFILNVGEREELPWDYDWYVGKLLSKMINGANACDTCDMLRSIEARMIKYDAFAELKKIGVPPKKKDNKSMYLNEQKRSKEFIQKCIELQRCDQTIEQLLEMLMEEYGHIKAPYTYPLTHFG